VANKLRRFAFYASIRKELRLAAARSRLRQVELETRPSAAVGAPGSAFRPEVSVSLAEPGRQINAGLALLGRVKLSRLGSPGRAEMP